MTAFLIGRTSECSEASWLGEVGVTFHAYPRVWFFFLSSLVL